MAILNRRRFLLASAAVTLAHRGLAENPSFTADLTIHPEQPGPAVPANFLGLSYETQQLSDPSFFSPENRGLIAEFRKLAPHGVLRIGGNTSDVSWWQPTPATEPPEMHVRDRQGNPAPSLAFPITPQAVRNLRGFLDATGWTCLYGINLATNTPARAADQGAFVAKTLGGKLDYFLLGNEPDLYVPRLREAKSWNGEAYIREWLALANAIRAVAPEVRFGLPDTGGWPDFYPALLHGLLTTPDPPAIAAVTHHYYLGGPPSNPDIDVLHLLRPGPRVQLEAHDVAELAASLSKGLGHAVPYHMTEGNTCYQGGKPGVSDVFAAALWAADYLLLLASLGYAGANLHGGDGKMVANSLGGSLPGEALMPDPKAPHPRPFYTPIAHLGDRYVAEPVAYGMKLAHHFAGATMLKLDFDPGTVNATAYAAREANGAKLLAVVNKDASSGITLRLPNARKRGFRHVYAISAASLTATTVLETPITQPTEGLFIPSKTAIVFRQEKA